MSSDNALKGNLNFLGLGELLQLLGGSGSTGIIKLTSIYANEPGLIYLVDGTPVNAEYGERKGMDALNSFFGWMDAQFEFLNEDVNTDRLIKKSRMEIILDGLRMVDDGLIEKLGKSSSPNKSNLISTDSSDLPVIKGPLIDYIYVLDEEEFQDGKEIVTQEKYGNWFWVILRGTVEVVLLSPSGPARIVRLSDGSFIGSVGSLIKRGNVRSASIVAIGQVQLGILDYDRLFREFSSLSDKFQGIMVSFDNRLRQITSVCTDAIFNNIELQTDLKDLTPFMKDDKDDERVLKIVNGEALVTRKVDDKYLKLCSLGKDDIIGHIPFISTPHEPHSASVYVSQDFEADEVDIRDIKEEYDQLSDTLKNMIQHTETSMSVTTGRIIDLLKNPSFG